MNNDSNLKSMSRRQIEKDAVRTLCDCNSAIDNEVSPSKNCNLCPWLEAKQCLNTVYSKIPESPLPKKSRARRNGSHFRIFQLGLKSERASHCSSNKENQEVIETKTVDNNSKQIQTEQPAIPLQEIKIKANKTTCSTQCIMRKNNAKLFLNEKIKIKWSYFQRETKPKLLTTLPNILKDSFLNFLPKIKEPKTVNTHASLNADSDIPLKANFINKKYQSTTQISQYVGI
jgi:hypothetical protein